ncbi:hypothetical protein C8Q77DRAFT_550644 [Trametes polyzona]|nr:hypothetical protein C8Q77DRAFT_550644 [Trametes polyzona]
MSQRRWSPFVRASHGRGRLVRSRGHPTAAAAIRRANVRGLCKAFTIEPPTCKAPAVQRGGYVRGTGPRRRHCLGPETVRTCSSRPCGTSRAGTASDGRVRAPHCGKCLTGAAVLGRHAHAAMIPGRAIRERGPCVLGRCSLRIITPPWIVRSSLTYRAVYPRARRQIPAFLLRPSLDARSPCRCAQHAEHASGLRPSSGVHKGGTHRGVLVFEL